MADRSVINRAIWRGDQQPTRRQDSATAGQRLPHGLQRNLYREIPGAHRLHKPCRGELHGDGDSARSARLRRACRGNLPGCAGAAGGRAAGLRGTRGRELHGDGEHGLTPSLPTTGRGERTRRPAAQCGRAAGLRGPGGQRGNFDPAAALFS